MIFYAYKVEKYYKNLLFQSVKYHQKQDASPGGVVVDGFHGGKIFWQMLKLTPLSYVKKRPPSSLLPSEVLAYCLVRVLE